MIECQTASPISFHSLFHISLTAVWVDQTILYLIAFIHTESCGNILLLASSFLFPSLEISWSSFKTLIKKNISMYLFSQVKANNYCVAIYQLSSVAQSCQTLWGPWNCPMHLRPPCPSPTPGDCSNSCPSSQWCRQVISSSAVPFSSCLQSFSALGSFLVTQFFTSCDKSIGVSASASVLPMTSHVWFPLGLTGLISCIPRDFQKSSPTPQFKSINSFSPHPLQHLLLVDCWM